jgi:hypothetical protein
MTAPNLRGARFSSAANDEIILEFDQPVVWKDECKAWIELDGQPAAVSSGKAAGNALTLALNNVSDLSGLKVNGSLTGSAVDGYLVDVLIFVDTNNNNAPDQGEGVYFDMRSNCSEGPLFKWMDDNCDLWYNQPYCDGARIAHEQELPLGAKIQFRFQGRGPEETDQQTTEEQPNVAEQPVMELDWKCFGCGDDCVHNDFPSYKW